MPKLLSIALVWCLSATVFPAPAQAAEVWDGTTRDISWYVADPAATTFVISDAADLAGLAALVNASWGGTVYYDSEGHVSDSGTSISGTGFAGRTISLAGTVDLGGALNPPKDWTPIGADPCPFRGVFDGGTNEIRHLFINAECERAGLFGTIDGGAVMNLVLTDCKIIGAGAGVGAVAGLAVSATIEACAVHGSIRGAWVVGGLAGSVIATAVDDCLSTAAVLAADCFGGLIGEIVNSSVSNCCASGLVNSSGLGGGGFAATLGATAAIHNSFVLESSLPPLNGGSSSGLAAVSEARLESAELAWTLNTTGGTQPNSAIWAQGATPVFADGVNCLAARRVLLAGSADPTAVYSDASGVFTLPDTPVDADPDSRPFLGWFADPGISVEFTPPAHLTEDITVYANFGKRIIALADYSAQYSGLPVGYAGQVTDNALGVSDVGLTHTYYVDPAGLTKTTTANSGSALEGSAPVHTGTYYVRATADADSDNKVSGATTNLATMRIVQPVVYHSVLPVQSEGGRVAVSSASVRHNSRVTVTVTADQDYEIVDVLVNDVSHGAVGSVTIPHVTAATTVRAVFRDTLASWTSPFADIPDDAWYRRAVAFVCREGLFAGTGPDTFEPEGTMTRGMAVAVLFRLSGAAVGGPASGLTDVPDDAWYGPGVAWAAANGIAGGVGQDSFAPNAAVSCEQLVLMLYNYAQHAGLDVSLDAAAGADVGATAVWARDAMGWAVTAGIVSADDASLRPAEPVTRAEVAVLLQSFIERLLR